MTARTTLINGVLRVVSMGNLIDQSNVVVGGPLNVQEKPWNPNDYLPPYELIERRERFEAWVKKLYPEVYEQFEALETLQRYADRADGVSDD